jgi:type-F conjugative transfer system pilin assembly protein TrbC
MNLRRKLNRISAAMILGGCALFGQHIDVLAQANRDWLNPELQDRTKRALEQATGRPAPRVPDVILPPRSTAQNPGNDITSLTERFSPAQRDAGPMLAAFVSTSVPMASLEKMAKDMQRVGGVMIMRGLIDGSMKKTVEAMANAQRHGVGLQIDPEAFKKHNVTVVPSFVVDMEPQADCSASSRCASRSALIEGDVSVGFALERMRGAATGTLRERIELWLREIQTPVNGAPAKGVMR